MVFLNKFKDPSRGGNFAFAESPPSVSLSMGKEMCGFLDKFKDPSRGGNFVFAESPPSVSLSMKEKLFGFP